MTQLVHFTHPEAEHIHSHAHPECVPPGHVVPDEDILEGGDMCCWADTCAVCGLPGEPVEQEGRCDTKEFCSEHHQFNG